MKAHMLQQSLKGVAHLDSRLTCQECLSGLYRLIFPDPCELRLGLGLPSKNSFNALQPSDLPENGLPRSYTNDSKSYDDLIDFFGVRTMLVKPSQSRHGLIFSTFNSFVKHTEFDTGWSQTTVLIIGEANSISVHLPRYHQMRPCHPNMTFGHQTSIRISTLFPWPTCTMTKVWLVCLLFLFTRNGRTRNIPMTHEMSQFLPRLICQMTISNMIGRLIYHPSHKVPSSHVNR